MMDLKRNTVNVQLSYKRLEMQPSRQPNTVTLEKYSHNAAAVVAFPVSITRTK